MRQSRLRSPLRQTTAVSGLWALPFVQWDGYHCGVLPGSEDHSDGSVHSGRCRVLGCDSRCACSPLVDAWAAAMHHINACLLSLLLLLADILPGQGLYYEVISQTWRWVHCLFAFCHDNNMHRFFSFLSVDCVREHPRRPAAATPSLWSMQMHVFPVDCVLWPRLMRPCPVVVAAP